tara:strand:+ start:58 stop:552 length:495 start_codon:yes stop_codon:yes gene_type:complete
VESEQEAEPRRKRSKPDHRSSRADRQGAGEAALKSQSRAYKRKVDDDGSGRSSADSGDDDRSSGEEFKDDGQRGGKRYKQPQDWKGQTDSMHDQQRRSRQKAEVKQKRGRKVMFKRLRWYIGPRSARWRWVETENDHNAHTTLVSQITAPIPTYTDHLHRRCRP